MLMARILSEKNQIITAAVLAYLAQNLGFPCPSVGIVSITIPTYIIT
jgi:hypothetical protein